MTELEACVLAVVWRQGPMSAYQVRREFERSPASSWRASTGSIYPLIKRLRTLGLVDVNPVPHDGRKTALLLASKEGRAQVRSWLKGAPPWLADVAEDPIRTRVQFLTLLDATTGSQVANEMLLATEAAIERLREFMTTFEIRSLERLAHEGALVMLLARLGWLKRVRSHFARSLKRHNHDND